MFNLQIYSGLSNKKKPSPCSNIAYSLLKGRNFLVCFRRICFAYIIGTDTNKEKEISITKFKFIFLGRGITTVFALFSVSLRKNIIPTVKAHLKNFLLHKSKINSLGSQKVANILSFSSIFRVFLDREQQSITNFSNKVDLVSNYETSYSIKRSRYARFCSIRKLASFIHINNKTNNTTTKLENHLANCSFSDLQRLVRVFHEKNKNIQ